VVSGVQKIERRGNSGTPGLTQIKKPAWTARS
jgi:hypothetical protein